jgi:hypothetical protein
VVKVVGGLKEDMRKQVVAHSFDHPVADGLHKIRGQEGKQALAEDDHHYDPGDGRQELILGDVQGAEDGVHETRLGRQPDGGRADEHLVDDGLDQVDKNIGEAGHEQSA